LIPSANVLSPPTGRCSARSNRTISANAWASAASDFAPDTECRSRYRAADLGLTAYTVYPAAISEATHGAALGLDPDHHLQCRLRVAARVRQLLGDQGVQSGHPGQTLRETLLRQNLAVLIDELDVVVVLGPVVTHEQHRTDPP
jgi:hypothetical protein